jgi:hypothetical protein
MKIKKSTKIQGKELTKKVLKYSIGEREREREREYPMKEMMGKVREEELGCGAADDQVGEESKKMEEKIRLRDHSV